MKAIEKLGIDTVRILAADAVQKADSGHPGTPMGLAAVGHVLWKEVMNYNPKNPDWDNRDRFILSCGHACLLQYIYLYLTGYNLTLNDLKNFRQLHSKTAGHPEYDLLSGIEVTTGPLGQGFANGVGMAIAQQYLAKRYNKPNFNIFEYKIYSICSDGDLMEGVSAEAASVAGHLGLGNLIYLYDDNQITIEGETSLAFSEDVTERFQAYGWHVQTVADGNDIKAILTAIKNAQKDKKRPSLIKVRTHIGFGSPNKVDTAASHGSALGEEEVKLVKENLGFDPKKYFAVNKEVLDFYRVKAKEGRQKEADWNKTFAAYKKKYPEVVAEFEMFKKGALPKKWNDDIPSFSPDEKGLATRKASGEVLNILAERLPLLIGGSADLSPSTDTSLKEFTSFSNQNNEGRIFHFGIREHAMGAILNGIALTKGFIPFGGTFLIFSDYMRPPMRLAAIMGIKSIYIFTHDSIGLGEDGTTHQPVEQLIGLRSVPNLTVIRPADANETAAAWLYTIKHEGGPVAIILTRQAIPILDQNKFTKAKSLEKGAYVLSDCTDTPDVILMATGSEVHLILEAQKHLAEKNNINARVVSFPSWELFEKQPATYKESVLPKKIRKRLAVEAGSAIGWLRYTTDEGETIGVDKFGESAPGKQVMKEYGFTIENILNKVKKMLK